MPDEVLVWKVWESLWVRDRRLVRLWLEHGE